MRSALVCDDHAMMREALSGLVSLVWPDAVVTVAGSFPEAWSAIEASPDLCICDLAMPGETPLEGIKQLRLRAPQTPILIVTGNEDDAVLLDLFAIGIAGFVPKTARSVVIQAAIEIVLAGERYLPQRLLELVANVPSGEHTSAAARSALSDRQIEILRLVAAGQSNKEVARTLLLSPSTIKAHLAAAMVTLDATNRTEAVVNAKRMNLI